MNTLKINFKGLLFFLVVAFTASSFVLNQQNKTETSEINWFDFQEGYDKAVKEKKPIMIDMYTDWCGWCKRMDRTTFADKDVVKIVNSNFIAVKFNPEKEGKYMVNNKIMTGQELKLWLGSGKHYGYPTSYFWMDPHNNGTIKMEVGYKETKKFLEILDSYLGN
jgi:uncharacterized protein YyaL (SSP411 family)